MSYSYREDLTFADMAFDVQASTPEELLSSAVDAMVHLMVGDLETIKRKVKREIQFQSKEPQLALALSEFLYDLLQKVIYYKDAQSLFLRAERIELLNTPQGFGLKAILSGEQIDPDRHELGTDVKGVTFYKYDVSPSDLCKDTQGWKATVVVDT